MQSHCSFLTQVFLRGPRFQNSQNPSISDQARWSCEADRSPHLLDEPRGLAAPSVRGEQAREAGEEAGAALKRPSVHSFVDLGSACLQCEFQTCLGPAERCGVNILVEVGPVQGADQWGARGQDKGNPDLGKLRWIQRLITQESIDLLGGVLGIFSLGHGEPGADGVDGQRGAATHR